MKLTPNARAQLVGMMTSMRFEAQVEDCIVEGEIPVELNGGFYRNGFAWRRGTPQDAVHPKTRDGMIQAFIFDEGRVNFINKWVRTPRFLLEERFGRGLFEWHDVFGDWRDLGTLPKQGQRPTDGVPDGNAGTNIYPWYSSTGATLLTGNEQCVPPIELDPRTLETRGIIYWSNMLSAGNSGLTTFTAHPKWDHETGEMYGWVHRGAAPYTTVHVVDADGVVKTRVLDDAPYGSAIHDGWLSEDYLILPYTPLYTSTDRPLKDNLGIFGWDPNRPSYVALVPRSLEGEVRYIETDFPASYILHTMGANQIGDKIILDAPFAPRPPYAFEQDQIALGEPLPPFTSAFDGRWVVDLAQDRVTAEQLSDVPTEFPKIDERFYGKSYEHGYLLISGRGDLFSFDTLVHKNVRTGKQVTYQVRSDTAVALTEPTFAPRFYGAPEGDGYLMVPAIYHEVHLSDLLIFDTRDISAGPIATVKMPFQMGWSAHGHYLDFNHDDHIVKKYKANPLRPR